MPDQTFVTMDFNNPPPSQHVFHWVDLIVSVIVVILFCLVWFKILGDYKLRSVLLSFLYIFNIAGEAISTTRGQFTTTLSQKLNLALLNMLTALGIICVTTTDIYFSMYNKMPMHGRRMFMLLNNIPIHAKCIVYTSVIGFQTIKYCSWEDRVRIGASLAQFALRLAEFVSRLVCKVKMCSILSNGISAVPLLLAMLCFAKRIFRKFDPPQDTVSCILVGNFERERYAYVPDDHPSSDLSRESMAVRPHAPVSRRFDIWCSSFTPIIGEGKIFTMMEMRHPQHAPALQIWYFPPADFIILHFSKANRASYDAIRDRWIDFVQNHNNGSRVIMIGTDSDEASRADNPITKAEGIQLAYQANAITYLEMQSYTPANVSSLFSEILNLLND